MILHRSGVGPLSVSTSPSMTDSSGEGSSMQLTPKKLSIETKDKRRLVEYFVVVSSMLQTEDSFSVGEPSQKSGESNSKTWEGKDDCWNFVPVVTSRYPLTDHADSPLSDGVTDFCHPVGYVVPSDEPKLPKVSTKYGIYPCENVEYSIHTI